MRWQAGQHIELVLKRVPRGSRGQSKVEHQLQRKQLARLGHTLAQAAGSEHDAVLSRGDAAGQLEVFGATAGQHLAAQRDAAQSTPAQDSHNTVNHKQP